MRNQSRSPQPCRADILDAGAIGTEQNKDTRHRELSAIERALDHLLSAAIADDEQFISGQSCSGVDVGAFRSDDQMPPRLETEVVALLEQPVAAACRQAVRRLGAYLIGLVDDTVAREVVERAAERDTQLYGRRLAIADAAMNGIGRGSAGWLP